MNPSPCPVCGGPRQWAKSLAQNPVCQRCSLAQRIDSEYVEGPGTFGPPRELTALVKAARAALELLNEEVRPTPHHDAVALALFEGLEPFEGM